MRRRTLGVVLAAVGLAGHPVSARAAPANDQLANAITVSTLPYRDARSIAGASVQSGEPSPACVTAIATVWYEITLAEQTPVAVTTTGSTYDTAIGLWTATSRSMSKLRAADCINNLGTQGHASLAFTAEPGVRYFVQMIRGSGSSGTLALRVTTGAQIAVPETPIAGTFSGAARIVFAVDTTGAEVAGRERLQFCAYGFCFTIVDIGQEAGAPDPAPRNCSFVLFVYDECHPA